MKIVDFQALYTDKDERRRNQIIYYTVYKMEDKLKEVREEILKEQSENNEGES